MNTSIVRILLFKGHEDKREVKLTSGLNIITGDSKTGKSALIEIIDYCLFSSRSTIPKGIINDFSDMFAVVLKICSKYIIIARPNAKAGEGNQAYIRVETDEDFLSNLTADYCKEVESKPIKDAQAEIERHLGISVLDTRTDDDDDKRSAGKATLRSFVPFLFQHQNLIANKHSLFYRFDDFYKRKKTIDDFPILIGWESSEYFLLLRELEAKKKELRAEEKLIEKLKVKDDELSIQLKSLIENYYRVIGMELDDNLSLRDLMRIAMNLPAINIHSYSNSNLKLAIVNKQQQRDNAKEELSEKELLLNQLSTNTITSNNYVEQLNNIQEINNIEEEESKILCPVCNSHASAVTKSMQSVFDSKNKLIEELSRIGTYTNDCSAQIESLRKERDRLKRQIGKLSSEIKNLEEQDDEYKENKSLAEQSLILKGATESNVKHLLNQNTARKEAIDLENFRKEIKLLEWKLDGFDLKIKIREAETFLSRRMTEICNKLDFEAELKPGKLQFSIEDFNFYYHFNDKEKIYLSEMGSGANWLSCHLSLFIALLHLNCISKKSSIPSFLVIDQPSQVYFPREYGQLESEESNKKEENIKQVKNIFKVIAEEIGIIHSDCGFEPQIIVMDHADEPEFKNSVKARWKKDGSKLI